MLKQLIEKILDAFGYELKRANSSGWTSEHLRKLGFRPKTVVDVGVGFGTPVLYKVFPKSYHVLIEPLVEFEPYLREILKDYSGQYFLTAIGAKKGNRIINVDPYKITKSSIYSRTALTKMGDSVEQREIPVTTLDTLFEKHSLQPPFGLKIDTEGFELQVIQGASEFLRRTEFVIAEISVAKRFEQSYSFADFIDIMSQNRFRLSDILEVYRMQSPPEIQYLDAVFKKVNS